MLHFGSLHATWPRLRALPALRGDTLAWIGDAMELLTRQLAMDEPRAPLSAAMQLVKCLALVVHALPLFVPAVSAAQSASLLALLHHLFVKWGMEINTYNHKVPFLFVSCEFK